MQGAARTAEILLEETISIHNRFYGKDFGRRIIKLSSSTHDLDKRVDILLISCYLHIQ